MILTEVSHKFRLDEMAARLARHGFTPVETFTDPAQAFALMLVRRRAQPTAPSPRLRSEQVLHQARIRTLELIAPLADEQCITQHTSILSPIAWDVGHIANFEEQWIRRAHAPRARRDDDARARDHLYDAVAHPRAGRGRLALLDHSACRTYLDAVRAETLAVLGVHCFGDGASEIVHIGQTVMASRDLNNIRYFTSTTFNYPTMAEAYRVAAYNGLNRLT